MRTSIALVPFSAIEGAIRAHLAAVPSTIDSYLEEQILSSAHYRIEIDGRPAGFASVLGRTLITQFAVDEPYRRHGQALFAQVRRVDAADAALVPTCDEFFLAHALDDHRGVTRQAFFFVAGPASAPPIPAGYALRPAIPGDVGVIWDACGDFFDPIERRIDRGELFVTERSGEAVGFGIIERSKLYGGPSAVTASIGMYTVEHARREGVGAATIALLRQACERAGIRPVAGCAAFNHESKRTLERAGMHAPTRLLRIDL